MERGRAMLLVGIQGKSDHRAPGEEPCSFSLFKHQFCTVPGWLVCSVLGTVEVLRYLWSQDTCALQETGLLSVLVPSE